MIPTPLPRRTTLTMLLVALVALVAAREPQHVVAQGKKYPYPTKRDLAATIPPGPKLLPSPPLGAGP